MKIYTLQIGYGVNSVMKQLEHTETISADDLYGGIETAKKLIRAKKWKPDSNFVRLLEEIDGDSQIKWFRPVEAVKGP